MTDWMAVEVLQAMTAEAVLTPIPILEGAQVVVAARFLREAAGPPCTVAAMSAFRDRWGPWLRGAAAGPVGPNACRLVA